MPVSGAQAYVTNVGYVNNNNAIVVPLNSTIQHKAKVGNILSTVNNKLVDNSWNSCTYLWDGSTFSNPSY
jgi:murein tripeptide amidase MpaA